MFILIDFNSPIPGMEAGVAAALVLPEPVVVEAAERVVEQEVEAPFSKHP
jgi:hypothetical protein